jgi:hypothetical protein
VHRLRPLSLLILCLSAALSAAANEDPWAPFEAAGAAVDRVEVRVYDVFDTSDPNENHWLGRAANFVHLTTRPRVVREALLFEEGDAVDAAVIRETERLLRNLPYIRDARITPRQEEDGTLTALVVVHDAWSLNLGAKLNSVGGQTAWRIRVHELNLFGFGKQILISHEQDFERITDEFGYADPQLFGTRWTFEGSYANLSDGESYEAVVERPFFELSTPWSVGFDGARMRYNQKLYDNDQTVYEFPSMDDHVSLYWKKLVSYRERTAWRAGVEFAVKQNSYGPLYTRRPGRIPEPDLSDRRFRGILLSLEVDQDRFRTYENILAVSRTEDHNLGWKAQMRLGYFSEKLGSYEDAWHFDWELTKGFLPHDETLVLLKSEAHGRKVNTGFQDVFFHGELTLYNQSFASQTLAADLDVVWGGHLDPESVVYLGGSDGLRGYPNHFRIGDRRWMVSVEDRFLTDWNLWGLVQAGFVVYADAGAIRWYHTGNWSRIYADVGGGLRFGNLKSAFGRVLLLTLAFPLVKEPGIDDFQVVVGNVIRF